MLGESPNRANRRGDHTAAQLEAYEHNISHINRPPSELRDQLPRAVSAEPGPEALLASCAVVQRAEQASPPSGGASMTRGRHSMTRYHRPAPAFCELTSIPSSWHEASHNEDTALHL